VRELVVECITWPENLRELHEALSRVLRARRRVRSGSELKRRQSDLKSEKQKTEQSLRNCLDLVGEMGKKTPKKVREEIGRLERRLQNIESDLAALTLPAASKEPGLAEIKKYASHVAEALEDSPPERLRELYRTLIQRIIVAPDKTKIEVDPGGLIPPGVKSNKHNMITDGAGGPA
jgi:hypothetical protein